MPGKRQEVSEVAGRGPPRREPSSHGLSLPIAHSLTPGMLDNATHQEPNLTFRPKVSPKLSPWKERRSEIMSPLSDTPRGLPRSSLHHEEVNVSGRRGCFSVSWSSCVSLVGTFWGS